MGGVETGEGDGFDGLNGGGRIGRGGGGGRGGGAAAASGGVTAAAGAAATIGLRCGAASAAAAAALRSPPHLPCAPDRGTITLIQGILCRYPIPGGREGAREGGCKNE